MNKKIKILSLLTSISIVLLSFKPVYSGGTGMEGIAKALAIISLLVLATLLIQILFLVVWFFVHLKAKKNDKNLILRSLFDVVFVVYTYFSLLFFSLLRLIPSPNCGYGGADLWVAWGFGTSGICFFNIFKLSFLLAIVVIVLFILNAWTISFSKIKMISIHFLLCLSVVVGISVMLEPKISGRIAGWFVNSERLESYILGHGLESICNKQIDKDIHGYKQDEYIEKVAKNLKNEKIEIREGALRWLSTINDLCALEHITSALKDPEPTIRMKAADALTETLVNINDPQIIGALISASKDNEPNVRRSAILALGKKEKISLVVSTLIDALKDSNPNVRKAAVGIVGTIRNPRVVSPLINSLNDEDLEVRNIAVKSLGKMKYLYAVEPLIVLLEKENKQTVRNDIVPALNGITGKNYGFDNSSWQKWWKEKYYKEIKPLIVDLKNNNWEIRNKAVINMRETKDPRSVQPLITALKDKSPEVRISAAKALGYIEALQAVEPLILALQDTNFGVRHSAALSLGWIGDPQATVSLINTLKDEEWEVRSSGASALGIIKATEAVEPLILALKDKSPIVRSRIIYALGEIKDQRAIEPLIASLKDIDYNVQHEAILALGKINDPRAVEPINTLLNNKKLPKDIRKDAEKTVLTLWNKTPLNKCKNRLDE